MPSVMGTIAREGTTSYAALWAFGLAFGWMEATTVLYLFAVHAPNGPYVGGLGYPLAALPTRLSVAEVVREACTMALLASASWLASARGPGRLGAFFLLFGLWDLVYYSGLVALAGWPTSLATWDVLFLIPLPWVGPVWAPALVALIFVGAGSRLFLTADRPRAYRWLDVAVLFAAAFRSVTGGTEFASVRCRPHRDREGAIMSHDPSETTPLVSPHHTLERALIDECVRAAGHDPDRLGELSPAVRERLLSEASVMPPPD